MTSQLPSLSLSPTARIRVIVGVLGFLLIGCPDRAGGGLVILSEVATIEALDARSLFTFAIFSDNKGDGPENSDYMAGLVESVAAMEAEFVLGLGDHLRGGGTEPQPFLPFLAGNDWWYEHFYPTIADGENAYYGSGQGDWGAGRGLTDDLTLCEKPTVVCRENEHEYHAIIPVGDVEIHSIVVHYPDTGDDPFPVDSREYLFGELASLERTGREIVIVSVHTGNWLRLLSDAEVQEVLAGADLLLGATTHFYMRYNTPDDQALFLNTGSTGYSLWNNYLQVNVLDAPLRLVIQNMEADRPRHLQTGVDCWVKEIGGLISPCDFVHGQDWPAIGQ